MASDPMRMALSEFQFCSAETQWNLPSYKVSSSITKNKKEILHTFHSSGNYRDLEIQSSVKHMHSRPIHFIYSFMKWYPPSTMSPCYPTPGLCLGCLSRTMLHFLWLSKVKLLFAGFIPESIHQHSDDNLLLICSQGHPS